MPGGLGLDRRHLHPQLIQAPPGPGDLIRRHAARGFVQECPRPSLRFDHGQAWAWGVSPVVVFSGFALMPCRLAADSTMRPMSCVYDMPRSSAAMASSLSFSRYGFGFTSSTYASPLSEMRKSTRA